MTGDNSKKIEIDDCWNKIGVQGNGNRSCSDLSKIIHCRNCSKFILAGRKLLDREPPADYKKDWCTQVSAVPDEQNKLQSIVIFRLEDQWFGLAPKYFHEVIKWSSCHAIPHNMSDKLKGIVAIRGELQLCISLGHLLGIGSSVGFEHNIKNSGYERMVVLADQNEKYVFPVSEIRDIHHYSAHELGAPPATAAVNSQNAIFGVLNWNDKYISCLDFEVLIDLINGIFE